MGCGSSKSVNTVAQANENTPLDEKPTETPKTGNNDECQKAIEEKIAKIYAIKESNPGNIMAQVFDREQFNKLSDEHKCRILKCCSSGIGNPGSELGCYAMSPTDYDDFYEFFKHVLQNIIRSI